MRTDKIDRIQKKEILFWIVVYAAALLLLSRVHLSDGDDTYFYIYSHEMSLPAYLKWRYETWVGRMTAETLIYLVFRCNLWVWRIVNAGMLIALPLGILKLSEIVSGVIVRGRERLCLAVTAVVGYFLMNVLTAGYAAIWVNGSIFYTWTFACGIWALVPVAQAVMAKEGEENERWFFATIPLALIASMSIEQMGAVLLAFEVLAILCLLGAHRRIPPLLLVQTAVTSVAFFLLFSAPGNDLRVATEIETWMPQYDTLSFGQHLFITVQWLLSSFANENRLFLAAIWAVGAILLIERGQEERMEKTSRRSRSELALLCGAVIFFIPALLPGLGIRAWSDLGLADLDASSCITQVPTLADCETIQIVRMVWWFAALLFTFVFLWYVTSRDAILLLVYLAGIASEAILYFSPTMYASGARIFYLTDLLYLLLILCLMRRLCGAKSRWGMCLLLCILGVWNMLSQVDIVIGMM